MAKCVYDGKGYLPECEHCIDTVGAGVVCTHDCVIELREGIEKCDALIKELADALEAKTCKVDCKHSLCGSKLRRDCGEPHYRALIAKAREVAK